MRAACIGCCITQSRWGRGIAAEAARAVIWRLFQMEVNRALSRRNPLNPASGRVPRKCGMQLEGAMRGGSILRSDQAAAALVGAARCAD